MRTKRNMFITGLAMLSLVILYASVQKPAKAVTPVATTANVHAFAVYCNRATHATLAATGIPSAPSTHPGRAIDVQPGKALACAGNVTTDGNQVISLAEAHNAGNLLLVMRPSFGGDWPCHPRGDLVECRPE